MWTFSGQHALKGSLWNVAYIIEVELHAMQLIPKATNGGVGVSFWSLHLRTTGSDISHDGTISFSYDNIKACFQNSEYIREKLPRTMELLELRLLDSGDLNLKAHILCFVWFYFLLYYSVLLQFIQWSSSSYRIIYIIKY